MSTGTENRSEMSKSEKGKRDEFLAQIVDNHRMMHNYIPVTVKRELDGSTTYEGAKLPSNLFNNYSNIERLTEHYLQWSKELKEGGAPACICQEYAAKILADKLAGYKSSGRVADRLRRLIAM
jgi:hypothetical protein